MDETVRRRLMFKVILIGEISVGKTSLMRRFVHKSFATDTKGTIGADFMVKEMRCGDRILTLQIWDTAGGERFQSLGRAFYRGADCCVIVFDCGRKPTFDKVEQYKLEFERQTNDISETFPFALVKNKTDIEESDMNVVTTGQTENLCKKIFGPHCASFATSAKTGEGVEELFQWISEAVNTNEEVDEYSTQPTERVELVRVEEDQTVDKPKKCCS